jgi:hypothetical protein
LLWIFFKTVVSGIALLCECTYNFCPFAESFFFPYTTHVFLFFTWHEIVWSPLYGTCVGLFSSIARVALCRACFRPRSVVPAMRQTLNCCFCFEYSLKHWLLDWHIFAINNFYPSQERLIFSLFPFSDTYFPFLYMSLAFFRSRSVVPAMREAVRLSKSSARKVSRPSV